MKASETITIVVLGAFIILTGRSMSNSQRDEPQGVDVNAMKTLNDGGRIVYLGTPYSVVSYDGAYYQVGEIENGEFSILKTGRSLPTSSDFYIYDNRGTAVQKAKNLNDPQSGGFTSPAPQENEKKDIDDTVKDMTQNAYNLGGAPVMGW